MKIENKAIRIIDTVNNGCLKAETVVLVLSSIALVGAIFIEVICRYLLFISTAWAEEIARYLFIWMTYFGSAYALNMGSHIEIDISTQMVERIAIFKNKEKAKRVLEFVAVFGTVLFLIAFCKIFNGYLIMILNSNQTSPTMHIPMGYVYFPVLAGSVLTIFHGMYLMICCIWNVPLPKNREAK